MLRARMGTEGPEVMTRTGYATGTCGVEVLKTWNRTGPGAGPALEPDRPWSHTRDGVSWFCCGLSAAQLVLSQFQQC